MRYLVHIYIFYSVAIDGPTRLSCSCYHKLYVWGRLLIYHDPHGGLTYTAINQRIDPLTALLRTAHPAVINIERDPGPNNVDVALPRVPRKYRHRVWSRPGERF